MCSACLRHICLITLTRAIREDPRTMLWINGDRVEGWRRRRSVEAESIDRGHENKGREDERRRLPWEGSHSADTDAVKEASEITLYSADLYKIFEIAIAPISSPKSLQRHLAKSVA
ncbi:hypothetical protein GW17_00056402 [Ensete ventricosum]|nr:hypothetical protein GW17_00056402 [Ensete ventricosum]